MDNLLEYLVPLIFAAIYFLGNMFSKKGEDDSESPTRSPMEPAEDSDALERQRRIQEEIRRKIAERRGVSTESRSERAEAEPEVKQPEPEPVMQREAAPAEPARRSSETSTFSWDESDNAYEQQMASQLKRIESTKREAAKLQAKASKVNKEWGSKEDTSRSKLRGGLLGGTVRSSLGDPAAARAAFVYGEVLGQPVSMRKDSQVPGLVS